MLKSVFPILTALLLLTFAGCSFDRDNPLDPYSEIAQNAPYDVMITNMPEYLDYSDTVALTASAKDYEQDAITYQWSSNGGSFSVSAGTDTVFTAGNTYGVFRITCRATDEAGLWTDKTEYLQIGKTFQGVLVKSEIWTGPHTVTGDILVPRGKTLTIMPGSTVTFADTDSADLGGSSLIELICSGSLILAGTSSQPVILKGANDETGVWEGIVFSGETLDLSYTEIKNTKTALYTNKLDATYITVNKTETGIMLVDSEITVNRLRYSFISECVSCIIIENSTLQVNDSGFSSCVRGIIVNPNATASLGDLFTPGNNDFNAASYHVVNLSTNMIFARNNYWHSLNSEDIDQMIYDNEEGATGWVDFTGFLLSAP